ncbi:MAG: alpha/beta hydrolase [Planctomycetota bacterium]
MFRKFSCVTVALAVLFVSGRKVRGDEGTPAAQSFHTERNVVYSSPGGTELLLDANIPVGPGPFPAILVVHGGAWKSGNKLQLRSYAETLAKRGYATFAINYRLAPKHKHPAQIEDVREAVRWIRKNADKYHVDTNRIGAVGYSAGAHLVSLLATERERTPETKVHAVVAGGTPIDFRVLDPESKTLVSWLGGTRGEIPQVYEAVSPYLHVSSDDPPMYFFHGDADELVDIRGAQEMVKSLTSLGIPSGIYVISGGKHIPAALDREAQEAGWRFFDEHLKGVKEATAAASGGSAAKAKP